MKKRYYGVDYYPEHRSEEEFVMDLSLFEQAGINVVRMGEFAWSTFEPTEGNYTFDWMEQCINTLGAKGVYTVLCTPTASPPAWLSHGYPDTLYVASNGHVRPFGSRRHYCPNSKTYSAFCEKIVLHMANHFAKNPYIIGWHIDNELAQESSGRCCCATCRQEFQSYLANRYQSIEVLNEKMGNVFWSLSYDDFSQIVPPVQTIESGTQPIISLYYDNPSLRLAFERFGSDSYVRFAMHQANILRRYTNCPITTNATGFGTNSIDYYDLYQNLDVYSLDSYPDLRSQEAMGYSLTNAFARGVKHKPHWIVELSSGGGIGLWGKQGILQPYPGAILQEAIYGFASGAELITHFQFATFPFGAEQLDPAILDIDNKPRRRFYEWAEAARQSKSIEHLLCGSKIESKLGIVFDYDSYYALKIKPIHKEFSVIQCVSEFYAAAVQAGIMTDIIGMEDDFSKYQLLILPCTFVMSPAQKERIKKFVKNGGTAIVTFLCGAKNKDNVAYKESFPAGFGDMLGIEVTEYEPVFEPSVSTIHAQDYPSFQNRYWTESITSMGAQLIGTYGDSFRQGEGVLSRNIYGKGIAYYFGTMPDTAFLKVFLGAHIEEKCPFSLLPGTECITRIKGTQKLYFIFNFTTKPVVLPLGKGYVTTEGTPSMDIEIKPKGYAIIKNAYEGCEK